MRALFKSLPLLALAGCSKLVVLTPLGDVAARQRDLLVESTLLMLLIIVPVLALVVVFAWKYRASNKDAKYEPEWDHSTHLELAIWSAPLIIVICLGALTWLGTHLLDPYRPLDRIGYRQAINRDVKPLQVEVVSLDWKWLFFYPDYGIATVGEMAAPVNRPIDFRLTSGSVMNAFYVPALAGMVYAMPAMETRLYAVINHPGEYGGMSAHYSGSGFSGMTFKFLGMDDGQFDRWIDRVKADGVALNEKTYAELAKPSENPGVLHYKIADPKLYRNILTLCVAGDPACMSGTMEMKPHPDKAAAAPEGAHDRAAHDGKAM